jgi:nucleoside-diphosphate-sugar epimerase
VIGGTGTIGSAVVKALSAKHDVVTVGHQKGAFQVDLASPDSITRLFKTVGTCDAVVSTAGIAKFASLDELSYEDYFVGLNNKLMGQVNLDRIGKTCMTDGGVIHPHQRHPQSRADKRQRLH